jgi:hypothetical protein
LKLNENKEEFRKLLLSTMSEIDEDGDESLSA